MSSPKTYGELKPVIFSALKEGINRFDTAPSYGTESVIGEVLKSAENELGLSRKDYWLQTKIDAWQMMDGNIRKHFDDALAKFRTEYVDALLVHWPVPEKINDTWTQIAGLKSSGLVRFTGICNVRMRQLESIAGLDEMPDIIQIERSPLRVCADEEDFCRRNGIELQAYSPLCKMNHRLRDSAVLRDIAAKHGVSIGQAVMRWHVETGAVPIFATTKPERVREYSAVTDFSLDDADIAGISSLDCNHKMYLESFACPGF